MDRILPSTPEGNSMALPFPFPLPLTMTTAASDTPILDSSSMQSDVSATIRTYSIDDENSPFAIFDLLYWPFCKPAFVTPFQ
jgi:hypothetical protein